MFKTIKPEKLKNLIIIFIVFAAVTAGFSKAFSQKFALEIELKNQPDNHVVLGKVSGDNFQPVDTILLHRIKNTLGESVKKAEYLFPENTPAGMYRLVLGKTTYARVMNEAPQQFDFIFNDENLIFETDFEKPEENLLVVLSEENRVWFEFLRKEKAIQEKLTELEKEMDYYRKKDAPENKLETTIAQYNALQQQRIVLISEMIAANENTFAARLIKMYREPFLDGNQTKEERRKKFQNEYFNQLDFSDEALINSAIYTDKIFQYLTSYNRPGFTKKQLENEYIKAVDKVLANTNKNEKVYEFILNYIVHGFEVLKMEKVLNYIAENYSGTTCQTDEVSTLERKLEAQKMKVGTIVHEFTLTDADGFYITLSEIQNEKTLLLFWASWCPHCREMIPAIKNWAEKQNNLQVVAVSLDTSKTEWQNTVKELGIENWINLSDLKKWDGEVATKYNIYATPTLFLIDRERKILAKPLTTTDLYSSLPE